MEKKTTVQKPSMLLNGKNAGFTATKLGSTNDDCKNLARRNSGIAFGRYLEYLKATGIKDYRETQGNQGVLVLRRINEGRAEFLLVSLWESWDAIRAFAGDELEKAVYYPGDQKFLLALEPTVTHYEVPLPLEEDILLFLHGKETLL